jgi:2-polyprenyl-3-methyl-5-hydroxy-6-metoxy-1,4-benzoquinol methylase
MSTTKKRIEEQAVNYWVNCQGETSPCFGVHPMGGGGLFEVYYRHYYEVRNFLKHVPLSPASKVLELGCGSGRWALSLAPLVNEYVGIDVNHKAINVAESLARSQGINNATFLCQSIADIKIASLFDTVYLSGVSQYLSDESLHHVLDGLQANLAGNAVLIDRSTINTAEREVMNNDTYISVYRTPQEIAKIAGEHGWECYFQRRSYRFMRGAPVLCRGKLQAVMLKSLNLFGSRLFHIINGISLVADTVNPKPFEGGFRSHDFMFFKQRNG